MQSIDDKILARIRGKGRGFVFFSTDFTLLGESKSVLKAIERLVTKGDILRVARGIYCYPKIDKQWGLGVLRPTYDEIAQAIARRDKARIAPTGDQALNMLGLSEQVPMNAVYLTDGTARKVRLDGDRGILFKHTAPKNLAFTNKLAMLITFALKEIGTDNVTPEQEQAIISLLQNETKESVMSDLAL
ncbi:MAG: type IV toxin-antitoxin system AbiEi family antitoxin domain-containing protein, partial [Bacteroidales bacterium]|nr:type IV toxin-antitoxin system AbiEi family antitoxin domain-containing protein [Bacteroidales bacterium]